MRKDIFTLRYKGPTGGDCTAPYYVDLKGTPTVRDFINAVLDDKSEWGYIGIYNKNSIFGTPNIEFRYGETKISDEMEEYLDKIIIDAVASGGWSRMDYILVLKKKGGLK